MNSLSETGLRVVVFSKDRPLQLDATLSSLRLHASEVPDLDVSVIYKASDAAFASAYRVVTLQHPSTHFIPETDFKVELVSTVSETEAVLFLVDDTIVVDTLQLMRGVRVLTSHTDVLGVSYRLGRNTTRCYTVNAPQALPAFSDIDGMLAFDWQGSEHDFGYPLEVSSSLYRTADVLPLLERLSYRNPNTLEAGLAESALGFSKTRPRLACPYRSVALSVPVNLVQTDWENRAGSDSSLSSRALLERYVVGDRLNVPSYSGFVPEACHQELEFTFARDASVPTVSVVIRCYNQAEFLSDAVASVVAQTFADWEIVVVDDGSPDDTVDLTASLQARHSDRRIRLAGGPNAGLSGAMNRGVAASLGHYILPLDADDAIEPSMLDSTVALLNTAPSVAIAYTDVQQFGSADQPLVAAEFDPVVMPAQNQLNYCSLYRAEVWHAVGGYNPNMEWGYEDWDFWIGAVAAGYRAHRVPGYLFRYRIRQGSMYSAAVQHDAELRRRIRQNHPSIYRWDRRLRTWAWMRYRRSAFWLRARLRGFRRRVFRPPAPPE